MFSSPIEPSANPAPRTSPRRGGPLPFRTIWREVQAGLLEASAPHLREPTPPATATAGPRPDPYASAA